MTDIRFSPPKKPLDDQLKERLQNRAPALAKNVFRLGSAVTHNNPHEAVKSVVTLGMKMAAVADNTFHNRELPILKLAHALLALGPTALTQKPEVLFAMIDQRDGLISEAEARENIISYHETGILKTSVPILIRNRIYGIRLAYTSDSAHTDWSVFEKVGGAFAGRIANFSQIEPLSAVECAQTIALLENLRPDSYSNEIKIYIAGCCFEDGFYTVEPVNYLAIAEPFLAKMTYDQTGAQQDQGLKAQIISKFKQFKATPVHTLSDEIADVQATKLLGVEVLAEKAIES